MSKEESRELASTAQKMSEAKEESRELARTAKKMSEAKEESGEVVSTAKIEESDVVSRERERRNLRKKVTVTIKALKENIDRNGSRRFISMYSKELEQLSKRCREVNDDRCDNYYEEKRAEADQNKQFEYESTFQEVLEVAEKHLSLRQDDSTTTNSKNEHEVADRMQDVVTFARAQNQELNEAVYRGTGRTTEEWVRNAVPNPFAVENSIPARREVAHRPFHEESELPDDWIDRYAAGLENRRI